MNTINSGWTNIGRTSVYTVTETGLDMSQNPIWDELSEAEQYNEEEFGGNGTIFELTVELNWNNATRVN